MEYSNITDFLSDIAFNYQNSFKTKTKQKVYFSSSHVAKQPCETKNTNNKEAQSLKLSHLKSAVYFINEDTEK